MKRLRDWGTGPDHWMQFDRPWHIIPIFLLLFVLFDGAMLLVRFVFGPM